jgi:hypothetical protein
VFNASSLLVPSFVPKQIKEKLRKENKQYAQECDSDVAGYGTI